MNKIYKLNRARLCINLAIMIVKLVIGNGPIYTGDGSFVWDKQSTVKNGERTVERAKNGSTSDNLTSYRTSRYKSGQLRLKAHFSQISRYYERTLQTTYPIHHFRQSSSCPMDGESKESITIHKKMPRWQVTLGLTSCSFHNAIMVL